MDWITIALSLGDKLAETGLIKLKRKYKEEYLKTLEEIQEEDDKPLGERDMNKISHLKRSNRNLIELFRNEIEGKV